MSFFNNEEPLPTTAVAIAMKDFVIGDHVNFESEMKKRFFEFRKKMDTVSIEKPSDMILLDGKAIFWFKLSGVEYKVSVEQEERQ